MRLAGLIVLLARSLALAQATQPSTLPATRPVGIQFDFKGMRVGDQMPDGYAFKHVRARDADKPDVIGFDSVEIGGKEARTFVQFENRRMIGFWMQFESETFEAVVAAYAEKFGEAPQSIDTGVIKNRMGAEFANATVRWQTDAGVFEIQRYADNVTKGNAILLSPEWLAFQKKQAEERAKKDKDRL